MYHPSNGFAPQFISEHREKQRWNGTIRSFNMDGLPMPNGCNEKQPIVYRLVDSARAALINVRRLVGQFWQVQSNSPAIDGPKLPTVQDSGFSMPVFVLLCVLWYTTSALSSNTGKVILSQFRYPITLTFIQFGFVAGYCLLFMAPLIRFSKLRKPTKTIVRNTFPMGLFQVGGHMFSSMAISRIPVSTVHTIKVSFIVSFPKPELNFYDRRFHPYSLSPPMLSCLALAIRQRYTYHCFH